MGPARQNRQESIGASKENQYSHREKEKECRKYQQKNENTAERFETRLKSLISGELLQEGGHLLWVRRPLRQRFHGELAQRAEHQEGIFLQDVREACSVLWSLQGICILAQVEKLSLITQQRSLGKVLVLVPPQELACCPEFVIKPPNTPFAFGLALMRNLQLSVMSDE